MQTQTQLPTQTTRPMRQSPTRSATSESHLAKRPREDDGPGNSFVQGYNDALGEPNTPLVFTPPSNFTDALMNALWGPSDQHMNDTAESLPASDTDIRQRKVERGMRALGTALKLNMELLPQVIAFLHHIERNHSCTCVILRFETNKHLWRSQDAISRYARCLIEQRGFSGPEFLSHFTHSRDGTPLEGGDTHGQLKYVLHEVGLPEDVIRAEAVRASQNRYLSQLEMIMSHLDLDME